MPTHKSKAKAKAAQHAAHGPTTPTTEPGRPPQRQWRWSSLADSTISIHPPIFTKDGSHFFSIVGTTVKIHSATTGKIVSTLPGSSDEGHADTITSAVLSPQNAFQLITASLDGTIKIWDFLEGVLLHTIGLDQPVHRVCTHEKIKDYLFVAAAKNKKSNTSSQDPPRAGHADTLQDESCIVLRISLKMQGSSNPEKAPKPFQVVPIGKTRATAGLAVSASGERLIAVAGHKAYVAQTSNLKSGFIKFVSPEPLTCLAVHPSEDYFATGDAKGVVRLWYCLDPKLVKVVGVEKKSQTSMLHWHAHAVSSVTFTTNGAYLLSGGEESVLVIWQLHSGKREFVPRVGSPIKNIVVAPPRASEEEYLLALADASYAFVSSATLKLSRAFAQIRLDPLVSTSWPSSSSTPLAFHRPSETLILPSCHPSSLQAYSPSTSTLIAELEVSPSNRVSRRDDKALEPARVERVAISPDGDWMVTVDRREGDESFRAEIYLKFWYWDKRTTFWILNTRIDRPHGLAKVTSLSFCPDVDDVQLVTTGEDGYVKMWRIRRTRNKKGSEEVSWTSRSSFSLRSDIPRHASWSHDGSLLAVPIGSSVVLYNPNTNAVQQSFLIQECRQPSEAHFIGRTGRYLAVIGGVDLVVWDVIFQSVRWHHKNLHWYSMLMSHPYQDTFITIHSTLQDSTSTSVTLFCATSPAPVMEHTLPFGIRNIAWYQSFPLSSDFSLVALTHKYAVVVLGDNAVLPEDSGVSVKALQKGPPAPQRSLFEEMFGVPAITKPSNPNERAREIATDLESGDSVTIPWRSSDTTDFFDAPSHLMPPIETFFEPLINSFLRLRTTDDETPATQAEEPVDVEDDMPVDPIHEADPDSTLVVNDEAVLDVFIPLFKEMADSPDYAYRSNKTVSSPIIMNGSSKDRTLPISHAPTKNSVHSDIRLPSPDQSTPMVTTKTGRKRSRPSHG